jgi:hypothetical protein
LVSGEKKGTEPFFMTNISIYQKNIELGKSEPFMKQGASFYEI